MPMHQCMQGLGAAAAASESSSGLSGAVDNAVNGNKRRAPDGWLCKRPGCDGWQPGRSVECHAKFQKQGSKLNGPSRKTCAFCKGEKEDTKATRTQARHTAAVDAANAANELKPREALHLALERQQQVRTSDAASAATARNPWRDWERTIHMRAVVLCSGDADLSTE
jgi:hypothetical protein